MNKHVDTVKVFNQFFNTTRTENENFIDYLTRFEKNYGEVQKIGEGLSSTFRAILLLRQADLTNVDHQTITANLEFDPTSSTASMH